MKEGISVTLPSGAIVTVASIEQLIELEAKLQRLAQPAPTPERQAPLSRALDDTEGWAAFSKLAHGSQVVALRAILANGPEPTPLSSIARVLGMDDNQRAGGVVSAVRRNAKKARLNPDLVITRLPTGDYCAGPLLLMHGLPDGSRKTRYDHILEGKMTDT